MPTHLVHLMTEHGRLRTHEQHTFLNVITLWQPIPSVTLEILLCNDYDDTCVIVHEIWK